MWVLKGMFAHGINTVDIQLFPGMRATATMEPVGRNIEDTSLFSFFLYFSQENQHDLVGATKGRREGVCSDPLSHLLSP